MPRIVNVDERQQLVAEAAWRVLVRDGPADLSVRKVAAEAGLSPSSLRYSFPTQASVRSHAVALLLARLDARVDRVAGPGKKRAAAMLHELLPLDEERRLEMEVLLSFGTMAMTDPDLRGAHQEIHLAVREVCARAAGLLGIAGEEVAGLHALIDGLALHLVRRHPRDGTTWAVAALSAQLARLTASPSESAGHPGQ